MMIRSLAAAFALGLMSMSALAAPAFAQAPPPRAPVAKTWTDHTFTGSDGTVFHYVEQGSGTPVILIHGLTSSAVGNWFNTGVGQRLALTNRVIALDMRGHGQTGPSPADSTGTMIHDVVELMDHLGIPKAHIGGYSMGGATTAGLLREAPERFITASLMGIGIRETEEWQGKGPTDPRPPVAAAPAPRPSPSPSPAANATPPARGTGDITLNAAGIPRGAPRGAPIANQDVDLTKIHFPVLALNGGNDSPLAKTHRMWRELQDFTYVVVPDRNHMQTAGDPRFADALVRFITSHNP
jgi:pimeloyl-ACP methyl ester carboxylesterase